MDRVSAGVLDAGKGLRDSANYGGRRQVTLIALERWTEMMDALKADVDPSARRANLLVSGLDLFDSRDRLLRVGTSVLQIGGETRPCERMEEAYPGLQRVMTERWGGGAWAIVLAGGEIQLGDAIEWLPSRGPTVNGESGEDQTLNRESRFSA